MRMIPLLACGLAATTAFAAPAFAQYRSYRPAPVAATSAIPARLLAAHNQERARWGVPPLRWDPLLAASAASYGPALAGLRSLQHSPRSGRPGQAENLWMGPAGRYSPEQMVGSWSSERAWFRPGLFPNVSSTGNWLDVSHYTQMIWRTTTAVGCAIHRAGGTDYLICRYSPRGNQDNRQVP